MKRGRCALPRRSLRRARRTRTRGLTFLGQRAATKRVQSKGGGLGWWGPRGGRLNELLVLATNTMHKVADAVQAAVSVPLIHIADATADAVHQAGLTTVGLLGTRFTMEQPFYRDRLSHQHGLRVLVPPENDRAIVHRVIYDELCLGKILPESRTAFRRIMAALEAQGAQAIVLGCTEISLLVSAPDAKVPLFDTTELHARKAVEWALAAD